MKKNEKQDKLARIEADTRDKLDALAEQLKPDQARLLSAIVQNFDDLLWHQAQSEKSLVAMMRELVDQRDSALYWASMNDERMRLTITGEIAQRLSDRYGIQYFDSQRVIERLLGQIHVIDDYVDEAVVELFQQMGYELDSADVIEDADLLDGEDIA